MLFVPNYTVSYRGTFHPAGKAFEIDPIDSEEMKVHGTIQEEPIKQTPRRPGRPRKTE